LFILDCTTSTLSFFARDAFLINVKKSAIGSVFDIFFPYFYQLDLVTPGISPFEANSLKHMRHNSNLRRYPFVLPQRRHLLYFLVENFAGLFHFAINDFFAIF
jgi:hypothetical protein